MENLIYVIEDSEQLLTTFSLFLKSEGFQVLGCNDGERGLERYYEFQDYIKLVISDVNLPNQSGVELTRKIRQINPTLPIILMSGYNNSKIVHECDENMTYLQKPFDMNLMVDMIKSRVID